MKLLFILDLRSELGIKILQQAAFDKNHEKKNIMIWYCKNCPFSESISFKDSIFNDSFLHFSTI